MRVSKHRHNRPGERTVNVVATVAGSNNGRVPTEQQSSQSPERGASAAPGNVTRPPAGVPAAQRQIGSSRTTSARPAGKGDEASASSWETDGGSGT